MAIEIPSYNQHLGNMLRKVFAITGVNDTHKGSVLLTLLEAAAQNDFEQFTSLLQLLDSISLDNANGTDLDKRAFEYGLTQGRNPSTFASGLVQISDSSITKVSTNLYVASNPPIAGDTTIKVNNATGFTNGAQIYIGRGTAVAEGPFTITGAPVNNGTSWTITITLPLAFNHSVNESVILAQGGTRTIPKGTKVRIPASNTAPAITFATQVLATIADGETVINNVLVKADLPGTTGNASLRAIREFVSVPFTGAVVANEIAFSNAEDLESDDALRDRIKAHVQSLSKGIKQAILSGVDGVFSDEDNKRVTSSVIVEPPTNGAITKLYIDDGTGFEPSFAGRGVEDLIDPAAGIEQYLQIGNFPLVRAQVTSNNAQPFDLSNGGTVVVDINGVGEIVTLDAADFLIPAAATAIEVAESINTHAVGISARTAEGQTKVVIFGRADADEKIQVTGGTANDVLAFPVDDIHTLKLYKNDTLLSQAGETAILDSALSSAWSVFASDPDVLAITVNDKPTQYIRVGTTALAVSYDNVNYVNVAGGLGFSALGVTMATATPAQWATVLNQAISGASFSTDNGILRLTSDVAKSPDSKLQIAAGTLASSLGFSTTAVVGKASDYTLNRFSGQLKLTDPLVANDVVSAGTLNTRGQVISANAPFNFAAIGTRLAGICLVVDGTATKRTFNIVGGTTTIAVSNTAGTTWRYTASSGVFTGIAVDDYVVIGRLPAAAGPNEGVFRVKAISGATWFEVTNPSGIVLGATTMAGSDDIQAFASSVPPQVVRFADNAATTAATAVTAINNVITGATAIINGSGIKIATNEYTTNGSIQIPAYILNGASLGLSSVVMTSIDSHVAAVESAPEVVFPVAVAKGTVDVASSTGLVMNDVNRTSLEANATNANQWVKYLMGHDKELRGFIQTVNSTTVLTLRDNTYIANGGYRVVAPDFLNGTNVDEAYQQYTPFDFDQTDNLVVVLDGNELAKSHNVPLWRSGRVSSATSTTFNGTDLDASAAGTTSFSGTLWGTYDFADYKVWFKAHHVINPAIGTKNAIIYRSKKYGPTGNLIRVGYAYPTTASTPISVVATPTSTNTDVAVTFGSGSPRTVNWNAATAFNISFVGNVVTYAWDTIGGADPQFIAAGVAVGDVVTFNSSNFNAGNNGTFVVTSRTSGNLVVINNGTPFVESNKALGVSSALAVYPMVSNSAAAVVAAVNASTAPIEAVLTTVDPFGTSNDGSGLITRSTVDDTGITATYVSLVDGENFISTFTGLASPPFTLKNALSERTVTDGGEIYNFATNAPNLSGPTGESFKLIPTIAKNVNDHLNNLSISPLALDANIQRAKDGLTVQIASKVAGSSGSVQVTGGTANAAIAAVSKASVTSGSTVQVSIPVAQTGSFHAGQVVKASNTVNARKINAFDAITVVSTDNSGPGATGKFLFGDRASTALSATTAITVVAAAGINTYTITAGTGSWASIKAGDEVVIRGGSPFSAANEGTFPVISATPTVLTVPKHNGFSEVIGAGPFVSADVVGKVGAFYSPDMTDLTQPVIVRKLNERFASINLYSGGNINFDQRGVIKDFTVDIGSPFSVTNRGSFRVVAVDTNSFTVENPNATEEVITLGASTLKFWSPDSILVGDTLHVDPITVAGWFSSPNRGDFKVLTTGRNGSGNHYVTVDNTNLTVEATTLGVNYASIYGIEGVPFTSYRTIGNLGTDPSDTATTLVFLKDATNADRLSNNYSTQLVAEGKLNYSTVKKIGNDGYKYWTGLLRKVHRTVDGFDVDPVNFPGLKAAGVQVEVLPPQLRQIHMSLKVLTVTGLSVVALSDSIKNAVLSYIAALGVGEDVIFSQVTKVVQKIPGVASVTLLSPDPSTERIILQDNEKAIAFISDITVT